jgi:hypothetical protein
MSKRSGSFLNEILLPLQSYSKLLPDKTDFNIQRENSLDAVYSFIHREHSEILESRELFLSEMNRLYSERKYEHGKRPNIVSYTNKCST